MHTTARNTPSWAYILIALLAATLAVLLWFLLAGPQGEPPPQHRPPGDHESPTYPTSPPAGHTPPEGGWPHG